jgi:hypothetical protein
MNRGIRATVARKTAHIGVSAGRAALMNPKNLDCFFTVIAGHRRATAGPALS